MKYSEFLTRMLANSNTERLFMCNEAKHVALYDHSLSPEEEEAAQIHLKRFLAHMKRLLNVQYKQICAERGMKPDFYLNVLTHMFPTHQHKYQWLTDLRNRVARQEKKAK